MTEDRAAIAAVVQDYLDGLYEGDADKLAEAFHEVSALHWEQDGKVSVWPRDAWLKAVRERPSPRSQGLARGDEVLLIDQSSPTTAFVKLRCQIPPRYFIDYLSLLKVGGRWQVVQKVFTVRQEAA